MESAGAKTLEKSEGSSPISLEFAHAVVVPAVGFAIFLVINATSVWGGVFPFLPQGFQTNQVTLTFYLAQSLAFAFAFVASTVGAYFFPGAAKRMLVMLATAIMFTGSVFVIAAMYLPAATLGLVVAGGVFLGVGSAAFFMLWQRYFSAMDPETCNQGLLLGTALGALFYFALTLVPAALTAFFVPVVFLPLCALCLLLAVREMDFEQPMFQDEPRQHPQVYASLVHDMWRSAVCIAAIAFASGLARGVATLHTDIGAWVNVVSMAGSLVAALFLLVLGSRFSIRFGINRIFRLLFPVVFLGFLVFPFVQQAGLGLFAGVTYLAFSLVLLVMMMQSAQICRDRGTNPVFVYGFFGIAAYTAQGTGFLVGWLTEGMTMGGLQQIALLSLLGTFVIGMALFVISHGFTGRRASQVLYKDEVELPASLRPAQRSTAEGADEGSRKAKRVLPVAEGSTVTDRLSKQCLVAKIDYGLSSRETEVMELIARGRSVAAIAEELFISENTVRTHSKHIYTKLDIHSKSELSELLDRMDLSGLG